MRAGLSYIFELIKAHLESYCVCRTFDIGWKLLVEVVMASGKYPLERARSVLSDSEQPVFRTNFRD